MKSGLVTRRGEIYWFDFGVPGGSEPGFRRPAVVIQNDVGNELSRTTIVAAVTSRVPPKSYPYVVIVNAGEGGLRERSAVLLNQIRTVDQSRLEDRCGRLSSSRMSDIDEALRTSLGLT